jgi:branched-chain amino acid transport system ATP-binding protein
MFNIITGITKADSGRVFFAGAEITRLRAFERCRRGIARSFQIPHPFAGMTVYENLLVGAAFGEGKPEHAVYDRCIEILQETGLLAKSNVRAGSLTVDAVSQSSGSSTSCTHCSPSSIASWLSTLGRRSTMASHEL